MPSLDRRPAEAYGEHLLVEIIERGATAWICAPAALSWARWPEGAFGVPLERLCMRRLQAFEAALGAASNLGGAEGEAATTAAWRALWRGLRGWL